MGNDEGAVKEKDGVEKLAYNINRNEKRWESNVFAEPEIAKSNRRNLAPAAQGKSGLYGDVDDKTDWTKPKPIAAVISQKDDYAKPLDVIENTDYERKSKELYGNSSYKPVKKGETGLLSNGTDWRNAA